MSYREEDIAHENAAAWVLRKGRGHFEVYRSGVTHSTRVGIFHFPSKPDYALSRAIEHADAQLPQAVAA